MKGDGRGRAAGEIGAVLFTGAAHLVCENMFHLKGPFIAAALLGWTAYLLAAVRRDRAILRRWGLRLDDLGRAWRGPALVFALGAAALAAIGLARGTFTLPAHLAVILLLYPVWGIAQQFMLQAMVARNLATLLPSRLAVTLAAALLFAAVHLPDLWLCGATFLLALLFVPLYLHRRSLLPLGVAHGWLGALAYYWVLGRDPFLELFG